MIYWSIYDQNSACDHKNIELDYLHFGIGLRIIDWWWIYHRLYYYVYRLNYSSIVWWLFENRDVVLAEIEYFDDHWGRYIVGDLENGGQAASDNAVQLFEVSQKGWLLKGLKKLKYCNLCIKLNVCRKYQGKMSPLNLKLG